MSPNAWVIFVLLIVASGLRFWSWTRGKLAPNDQYVADAVTAGAVPPQYHEMQETGPIHDRSKRQRLVAHTSRAISYTPNRCCCFAQTRLLF